MSLLGAIVRTRSAILVAAATVAVLSVPAQSPAEARTADRNQAGEAAAHLALRCSPVGVWDAKVSMAEGVYPATLTFEANGRASNDFGGVGTWRPTGSNRFNFRLKEPMLDENGNSTGHVQVNQNATQRGDTFVSTGISKVYDANGKFVRDVPVEVRGTRG